MIVGHIGGGSVGGYQVQRSVRLRAAASAYFSWTSGSSGSGAVWSYRLLVKRGSLSVAGMALISAYQDANNYSMLYFGGDDKLYYSAVVGSTNYGFANTNAVFRDPSSWYDILFTKNGSTLKIYVNGVEQSITITNAINSAGDYLGATSTAMRIGHSLLAGSNYFDGYMTEVSCVRGQALTPTSFAEQDAATRMWVPKKYTGTYGTNGFYLDFSDITSTTTLGYDKSGNGNNWTANNISLTSGSTYDSMLDVPGLPWTDGGNGRGNYCTLSPLDKTSAASISNGNLRLASGSAAAMGTRSTIAIPTTGAWYFEGIPLTACSGSNVVEFGLITATGDLSNLQSTGQYGLYCSGSTSFLTNGTPSGSYGSTSGGDRLQCAVNVDTGKVWLGRNDNWFDSSGGTTGNPSTGANPTFTLSAGGMFAFFQCYNITMDAGLGASAFQGTRPTGFKALNTTNLPDPTGAAAKPWEHFTALTYLGNGSTLTVTGSDFKPDLVWAKNRSAAADHGLFDVVRGTGLALSSNLTNAEYSASGVTSFNSNGFSLGASFNAVGSNFISWLWKAGGAAVNNTAGSITSQVSANTAAGFSVVTYTGNNSSGTVGHGLGVTPAMVIVKGRGNAFGWAVWHKGLSTAAGTYLALNTTAAVATDTTMLAPASFNSSAIALNGNSSWTNAATTYVAYCFAEIPSFSRFTAITGNASADGVLCNLGFKPKMVILKCVSTTGSWYIFDTSRDTYNVAGQQLYPNLSNAESTVATLDVLSNGFKLRLAGDPNAAQTYIVAAWAESPFKYSTAR